MSTTMPLPDAPPHQLEAAPAATGRSVLAALAACMLLASLGTSVANVALPTLAQAFGGSFQAVQWVVLAYLLAMTTSLVAVGRLGDVVGRRLLLGGIALFALASGLCGFAPTLPTLIAARALQGLGAAVLMALSLALVAEAVPRERIGGAMGLLGTTSAIGTALGPSLGGLLIAGSGWRAVFLVNLPLCLAAFAIAARSLPAERPAPPPRPVGFDAAGTLLLGATLAAYALAMTLGRGSFGPGNAALLLAAAVGVVLFLRVESTAPHPLVSPRTLRHPVLARGVAASALVSTVVMATLVVGPFYLARGLGLDAALVGIVLSAGPIVAALAGVPAGRLVDRFGAARAMTAGLAGMAVGSFLLGVVPSGLGIPGYVLPILVLTAHYALFQAANNTQVMADLPPDQRGVVSGLLNLSRSLGLITGAAAMGAVFAFASGTPDVATGAPDAVAHGMRVTFGIAGLLLLIPLVALARARVRAAAGGRGTDPPARSIA